MKRQIISLILIMCMFFSLLSFPVYANEQDQQTSNISRYTVLVLDVSGSMVGAPMSALKVASMKFCEDVLKADGNNYVAIVTYASRARTVNIFTDDLALLHNGINSLIASGGTNINQGLEHADSLLSAIADGEGIIKNVLIFSDGLPNTGTTSNSGPYTRSDYIDFRYANATYNTAATLKEKKYSLYTLGFFHDLSEPTLAFARRFMNDLQNAGYYDVVDDDDLEFIFGDVAGDIVDDVNKFSYPSGKNDYTDTYHYDDAYFYNSSYTYNRSLATMSLCLAMAAGASNEKTYPDQSDNAKELLKKIGFHEYTFEANLSFTKKPGPDTIGVVAANKPFYVNEKEYTLIAVAVRGIGYEQEWASNFKLGSAGPHEGFDQAKNDVITFIKGYIEKNNISGDIKLWITGFSRAAAVANLVAGAINEGESFRNCTLKRVDLYAYTFGTPKGTVADGANINSVYKNIFNIINLNDPVTHIAPSFFKFKRFGIDKLLPTPETSSNYLARKVEMLRIYNTMDSIAKPYAVDNFVMKKITVGYTPLLGLHPTIADDTKNRDSQSVFLENIVTRLAKEQFISRTNYLDKFQDGIREAFKVIYGTKDEIDGKKDVKWTKFQEIFIDKLASNIGILYISTIPKGAILVGSTYELVWKYAIESLNEAGITTFNSNEIERFALTVVSTIISFAAKHPNLTTTLILNLEEIKSAHFPELYLAWLQSMDNNYTTNASPAFSSGHYRTIRINCPVDIKVYDNSNILVAEIKSDEPQTIDGSSIISSINEDGEKLIYLPANTDYWLEFTPSDAGYMTYSVGEFCPDVGEVNRIINYYDIPINIGDIFTSRVPAYSDEDIANGTTNGSNTVYTLLSSSNEPIAVSDDLKGLDATEAYYMVNVASNNDEFGYVTGQGIRQLGSYAQISAMPFNDCEFDGWYMNNIKISSDTQYRFRVQSDVDLLAVFTKDKPSSTLPVSDNPPVTVSDNPSVTVTANPSAGGTVLGGGTYAQGSIVTVTAKSNTGYRFVNWTEDDTSVSTNSTFKFPASANRKLVANFIPTIILGDVSGNGKVDVVDATMVMQHVLGLKLLLDDQKKVADVNGDGKIDISDVVLIMKKALSLINRFPAE